MIVTLTRYMAHVHAALRLWPTFRDAGSIDGARRCTLLAGSAPWTWQMHSPTWDRRVGRPTKCHSKQCSERHVNFFLIRPHWCQLQHKSYCYIFYNLVAVSTAQPGISSSQYIYIYIHIFNIYIYIYIYIYNILFY